MSVLHVQCIANALKIIYTHIVPADCIAARNLFAIFLGSFFRTESRCETFGQIDHIDRVVPRSNAAISVWSDLDGKQRV